MVNEKQTQQNILQYIIVCLSTFYIKKNVKNSFL